VRRLALFRSGSRDYRRQRQCVFHRDCGRTGEINQQWPDGKKVKIFLTNPDSPDSKLIVQRLYKMAPDKVKSLIDSHKADIQVAGSDDLVLRLVANNPGSIGIVNIYSINSTVKVLKVDDKLPLEQGYLLHGN
jgi:ABC-type phosphate transport system substrate-binding protein